MAGWLRAVFTEADANVSTDAAEQGVLLPKPPKAPPPGRRARRPNASHANPSSSPPRTTCSELGNERVAGAHGTPPLPTENDPPDKVGSPTLSGGTRVGRGKVTLRRVGAHVIHEIASDLVVISNHPVSEPTSTDDEKDEKPCEKPPVLPSMAKPPQQEVAQYERLLPDLPRRSPRYTHISPTGPVASNLPDTPGRPRRFTRAKMAAPGDYSDELNLPKILQPKRRQTRRPTRKPTDGGKGVTEDKEFDGQLHDEKESAEAIVRYHRHTTYESEHAYGHAHKTPEKHRMLGATEHHHPLFGGHVLPEEVPPCLFKSTTDSLFTRLSAHNVPIGALIAAAAHAKANYGHHHTDATTTPLPRHSVSPTLQKNARAAELRVLADVHWFASLGLNKVVQLYRRGLRIVSPRYAAILRENTQGSTMYVLLQGSVNVEKASKGFSKVMEAGACFGEEVLEYGAQQYHERKCTVTALTVCIGLRLTAADLQAAGMDLFEPKADCISRLIKSVPYFKVATEIGRAKLCRIFDVWCYCSGDVIFEQGEPGDKLYILLEGLVQVWKAGVAFPLATYKSGGERPWFGELALWCNCNRSATARCLEACKLLVLESRYFADFLETVPSFREMLNCDSLAFTKLDELRNVQNKRRGTDAADDMGDAPVEELGTAAASTRGRRTAITIGGRSTWRRSSAKQFPKDATKNYWGAHKSHTRLSEAHASSPRTPGIEDAPPEGFTDSARKSPCPHPRTVYSRASSFGERSTPRLLATPRSRGSLTPKCPSPNVSPRRSSTTKR